MIRYLRCFILKKWLDNGCVERPEEISEIIKSEYTKKELW